MRNNLLKVALRSFRKRPLLSSLNLLGLSIGLGCFLVIILYVFQENSFEKGFKDWERTYRVEEHFLSMGKVAWTPSNLQFSLGDIPEIEAYARLASDYGLEVKKDGSMIKTKKTLWTDDFFFKVFDYEVILGDKDKPLGGPGKAVITRSMAMKIYGSLDVVGQELETRRNGIFLVSAVVEDPLIKSHLDFDLLIHRQDEEVYNEKRWYNIGGYTYVKLVEGTSQAALEDKLLQVAEDKIFPNAFKPQADMTFDQWIAHENHVSFSSKPIAEIHLNSNLQFEIDAGGDRQTLVTLSIIATFILIIASINFMNLTTARSSGRTKEIGIRKVLGSGRRALVIRFLSETLIITFMAAIIGAAFSEVLVVLINQNFGDVIGISLIKYPRLMLGVGLGALGVGLVSGFYPAMYLSSAKVIPLLKGMKLSKVLNVGLSGSLRNGLVIFQFTLSTSLIIATLFIYNQLVYLKNKDLGFDHEQVLVITNANDLKKNKSAFKDKVLSIPGIEHASFTQRVPGDAFKGVHSVMLDANESVVMNSFSSDLDYFKTLGLEMAEGEWFSKDLVKTDSNVVINEAAVQAMGLEDPVGKLFGNYYRVVGVMKDFNYGSLKEGIGPAIFSYYGERGNRLAIRLDLNRVPVDELRRVWSDFSSEEMDFHWLERNFEELLVKEDQMANAATLFTVLAVFISCIGLFGLAAFNADQRLQEFGIRKVLGASVLDIIRVFSYDFIKLIVIAFLISVPLSIWGVNAWLQGFADRIALTPGFFALAGILAIIIAFSTILFQSIKAGRLNPVETLRNE